MGKKITITVLAAALGCSVILVGQNYSWYELSLEPESIATYGQRNVSKLKVFKRGLLSSEVIAPQDYRVSTDETKGKKVAINIADDGYSLLSLGQKGQYKIKVTLPDQELSRELHVVQPFADADQDGLPDVAELNNEVDKKAFMRWFSAIAESQYQKLSYDFYPNNQDCSGLIRYAYVQALLPHDDEWHRHHKIRGRLVGPDVSAFSYPDVPVLGKNLFLNGHEFSTFADAQTLMRDNCVPLGFVTDKAQSGDLLFFAQTAEEGREIWHSMIFLAAEEFGEDFVVYHTGPVGSHVPDGSGEVRKVRFADLMAHPDETWRPSKNNPNFRGFYRFKIVN